MNWKDYVAYSELISLYCNKITLSSTKLFIMHFASRKKWLLDSMIFNGEYGIKTVLIKRLSTNLTQ